MCNKKFFFQLVHPGLQKKLARNYGASGGSCCGVFLNVVLKFFQMLLQNFSSTAKFFKCCAKFFQMLLQTFSNVVLSFFQTLLQNFSNLLNFSNAAAKFFKCYAKIFFRRWEMAGNTANQQLPTQEAQALLEAIKSVMSNTHDLTPMVTVNNDRCQVAKDLENLITRNTMLTIGHRSTPTVTTCHGKTPHIKVPVIN